MIGTDIEIGGVIIVGLGIGTILAAKYRTDKHNKQGEKEYDDDEREASWEDTLAYRYGTEDDYDEWYRPQPAYERNSTHHEYSAYPIWPDHSNYPPIWQGKQEVTHVPKVTDVPEVLLYNGQPVTEGQILPVGDGKRQVKVIDPKPDKNGGIMVQENYYVDSSDIGCIIQPETVMMELTPEEARAILKFYNEALQRNTGQQPAVGESTSQFARPVFEQIGKTIGGTPVQ